MIKEKKILISICILLSILTIIIPSMTASDNSDTQRSSLLELTSNGSENDWYQEVQVYDILALSPEEVEHFHVTVNGLWNGFFVEDDGPSSPFALGRFLEEYFSSRTYESDVDFVASQHAAGLRVPATILTTQGHSTLQLERLEEFASRDPDGEMCPWDFDAESYWMNPLDEEFIQWCIDHGKKAIDADADMIVLDEIQGNGFALAYQWASQYVEEIKAPGFSNVTLEAFRVYLNETFTNQQLLDMFGIEHIEEYDLKQRIYETMHLTFYERVEEDPLIWFYNEFLEVSNFKVKKHLIEELREYADSQGKEIVIAANSYALGTPRNGGFWSKGLQFSDLLDCFTFENTYTASDETLTAFPRNKWLAWEKLAYAATDAPGIVLIDTNAFVEVSASPEEEQALCFGYKEYLGVQAAECYANQGSFVNYYFPVTDGKDAWERVGEVSGFVLDNKGLYEKNQSTYSSVGILYLYGEGMRMKSDSYLGCAQALAESDIAFEVLFAGDGFYMDDTLTGEDLTGFEVMVVPNVLDITTNQQQVVLGYAEQGGSLVLFDPAALGLDPNQEMIEYGSGYIISLYEEGDEDVASRFYHSYDEASREKISDAVLSQTSREFEIVGHDGLIAGFPYLQPEDERVVIHLVNYDHTMTLDMLWEKTDVTVRIRQPDFPVRRIRILSPDFSGETEVGFSLIEGMVEFVVPKLDLYNVIILDNPSSSDRSFSVVEPSFGGVYLFGKKIVQRELSPLVISFGGLTVRTEVSGIEMIASVGFLLDGRLMCLDKESPFMWKWHLPSFGIHDLEIIGYDDADSVVSSCNVPVFRFF